MNGKKLSKALSKFILLLVVLGTVFFVSKNYLELKKTGFALLELNYITLIPLLILSTFHIGLYARILQVSLRLMQAKIKFHDALNLWLASYFVGTMIPSGFFSGMTYLMLKAKHWKQQKTDVALGVGLSLFVLYLGVLIIFFFALVFQLISPSDNAVMDIAAQLLLGIVTIMLIGSIFLANNLTKIVRFLFAFEKKFLRFLGFGKKIKQLGASLERASASLHKLGKRWGLLIGPLLDAFLLHLIGISMLWFALAGVGALIPTKALVAGYVAGTLLTVVSISPAGLGFVEIVTPLVISGFGVNLPLATAGVLIWRIFNVWIVLGAGAISFKSLEKRTSAANK